MNDGMVIFGAGAHARKAYHCASLAGHAVSAFADEGTGTTALVPDVPVLQLADLEGAVKPGQMFVAIGRADVRQRLMDHFAARGWQLPALVHPRACVAPDVALADGVMIAAGAIVESGTRIGRGAIVDVGVIVDHDCHVAEFCHLPPGQICPPGTKWPA